MTTELQAVNQMLGGIGEAPVNSLEGALTTDVATAKNLLDEVRREVQGRAWGFNTDENVVLSPDANDEITVGAEIIRIDGTPGLEMKQIILRGRRLYNRGDHNFTFTADIHVNTTTLLIWGDIPDQAQSYMVVRASRMLADRLVGNVSMHQFTARDEALALAAMKQWDDEHVGRNVFIYNLTLFQSLNRGIRGGRRL